MINVGLVGFGFAGRTFHAPFIEAVPGLRLAAIVQRSGDEAVRLYPEAKVVRSIEELLVDPKVDLVVVATPNQSHFHLAKLSLEQNRHVVIDKPFTTTSAEAKELVTLAETRGKHLSVYFNRRWDGDFQTVQKLLSDGPLGRVVYFESHFDRFRPELKQGAWREQNAPGSGVLFDLGSHLIDQAMTLFGIPSAIDADIRMERTGAAVDDAFDVMLIYPDKRVLLRATMLANVPGARFTIHGTLGSYIKHGMDPQEDELKAGQKPTDHQWGTERQENWGALSIAEGEKNRVQKVPTLAGDYRKFYENVRDAIANGGTVAVKPIEALNVMIALELALQSSREGKRIPWLA
jgi:predicted dehydrogenase